MRLFPTQGSNPGLLQVSCIGCRLFNAEPPERLTDPKDPGSIFPGMPDIKQNKGTENIYFAKLGFQFSYKS